MTDPASREDLEAARDAIIKRIDAINASVENTREQTSQEHGSIITSVRDQNKETRAHIGSEVATVRGDVGHMKNFMERLLKAMKRFLGRHGVGSDDL
jgi:hypothetical protein